MLRGVKVGVGQDSHRFLPEESHKPCVIAGIVFEGVPGFDADSDGDVVFHSLCNAITSITHVPILGGIAIDLCHKEGIIDSQIYLEKALLGMEKMRIHHIAFTLEGKRPRVQNKTLEMRENIAKVVGIELDQVGMTSTSGDELTDFGKGNGVQCFCILTVEIDFFRN